MERSWYWRLATVVVLILAAVYYATPSVLYLTADPDTRRSEEKLEELIPGWLPDSRMTLGIDLQGGLHLVMGVDTNKAVLDRADRTCDDVKDAMLEKKKPIVSCRREGDAPVLTVVMQNPADWSDLREFFSPRQGAWNLLSNSGTTVTFGMSDEFETQLREGTVDQALTVLRKRVFGFEGIKEPDIRPLGDLIMIQIPGLTEKDYNRIKEEIIGKTAQLEFKIVDSESDFFAQLSRKPDKPASVELTGNFLTGTDRAELKRFLDKYPAPEDRVVALEELTEEGSEEPTYRTWLLTRRTQLTGDALEDAYEQYNSEEGGYEVGMTFKPAGARAFEELTAANVGKQMAIVLDGVVDSAPQIRGRIAGGRARITLDGTGKTRQEMINEASALATVLKAGALPAPVFEQEERSVGATLGDDAVIKGRMAITVALALVLVMMSIYYRMTGLIGAFALVINMLFLFAGLAAFEATLTLPGIAGLALTIGMAVDANIIQFERIREELAHGKTARAAVDAGFEKAFTAILDANVTTFLAAVVLQQFGSGPLKGFATTLMLGVVINTFTAVVVPKLILEYFTRGRRVKELSI